MALISGLIGGALAAGLGLYINSRPARAAASREGWRILRPRPVLHGIVLLSALMAALPAWALLSGGSHRPDAAEQNMAAAGLAIGFAFATAYLAWLTYALRISFRDGQLRVRRLLETREYSYSDIVGLSKSEHSGELKLTLRGGQRLRLSPYFSGLDEFEDSLAQHGVDTFG